MLPNILNGISLKLMYESDALHALSLKIKGGIPILDALKETGDEFPDLRKIFQAMYDGVRKGESLRESLIGYERNLQDFVPGMLEVGEAIGNVDTLLLSASRLIDDMVKFISEQESEASRDDIAILVDYLLMGNLLEMASEDLAIEIIQEVSRRRGRSIWRDVSKVSKERGLGVAMKYYGTGNQFPDLDVADFVSATTDTDMVKGFQSAAEKAHQRIFGF